MTDQRALADLHTDPNNARKHSPRNLDIIAGSLSRFGQRKPIVITPAGMILAGNGTFEAAKRLGWKHLDVSIYDATPDEQRAYALADNRSSELAEWELDTLTDSLGALDADLIDAAGWTLDEIQNILNPPEPPPLTEPTDTTNDITCPECGHVFDTKQH